MRTGENGDDVVACAECGGNSRIRPGYFRFKSPLTNMIVLKNIAK
jgi:hypothetical protein